MPLDGITALLEFNGSNDVAHYGVRGMKWGIRKDRKSSGTKKTSVREEASKLSDEELRARVARLNLEQSYVSLSQKKSSSETMILGKRIAIGIVAGVASELGRKALKGGLSSGANLILDSLRRS